MRRAIFHVDVDAFFASVEQRLNPALRGRPVIVGSGCIASCSYEARRFGLRAGMRITEAKRLCPDAAVLKGSQPTYRAFAEEIWELCRDLSPAVETYLDEAYLDMSGTERLWPDLRAVASELKAHIRRRTGLSVTIGIGPNRLCARTATKSAKPDGLAAFSVQDTRRHFSERPVEELPGVGHATTRVLKEMGIHTVRELRRLEERELHALFGKVGLHLYDRARGRDTAVVNTREVPKTISRETTFHNETSDPDYIKAILNYLVQRAGRTARTLGLAARSGELRLRYADFRQANRRRRLGEPTGYDSELYDAVIELFGELHTRRVSLRHVGIALSEFVCAGTVEMRLFDSAERHRRFTRAVDAVRSRFGFGSVITGKALELMNTLERTSYGYVLRTPSLTK